MTTNNDSLGKEFLITYTYDAPRVKVFSAWTEPRQLAQWWGPHGFTNPVCELDLRPGGQIYMEMQGPNEINYPMVGEFIEIKAPEKLVFTSAATEKGNKLFEFQHTVTFVEKDEETTLTIQSKVIATTAGAGQYISGYEMGMTQSLEKLSYLLDKNSEALVVERILNAPIERVWKALTIREEMVPWFFELKEFQAEVGFKFEFYGEKDGVKYAHQCRVTEVIPQKKLSYTWRYEGHSGDTLVTIELFPEGNKTKLTLTHSGLESLPPLPDFTRTNFNAGWHHIIGMSLNSFVEKTAP